MSILSDPDMRPRLVPVIDVQEGRGVRAVAGQRDRYSPVRSRLTASDDPVELARAVLAATGAAELYVADLDALGSTGSGGDSAVPGVSPAVVRLLEQVSCPVWLDAGLGFRRPPAACPDRPHLRPVVGLETATDPAVLAEALARFGPERVAVSLDLMAGRLLGEWRRWGAEDDRDAPAVVRTAVAAGVRTVLVLDLARVGTGRGPGTEDLLRAIRSEYPQLVLLAGGGVRSWDDIDRLGAAGADGVLVASALHDGTLTGPRY